MPNLSEKIGRLKEWTGFLLLLITYRKLSQGHSAGQTFCDFCFTFLNYEWCDHLVRHLYLFLLWIAYFLCCAHFYFQELLFPVIFKHLVDIKEFQPVSPRLQVCLLGLLSFIFVYWGFWALLVIAAFLRGAYYRCLSSVFSFIVFATDIVLREPFTVPGYKNIYFYFEYLGGFI